MDNFELNDDQQIASAMAEAANTFVPPAVLKETVRDRLFSAAELPRPSTSNRKVQMMKTITRVSIAATVLVALVLGAFGVLSPNGSSSAFADMADAFLKIQTTTCRLTSHCEQRITLPGGERTITSTSTGKLYFLAPSLQRIEMETTVSIPGEKKKPERMKMEMIQIFDVAKGKMLSLTPAVKLAMLMQVNDMSEERKGQANLIFNMRELLAQAKAGKNDTKVEPLGEKTIDGHAAVGYSLQGGSPGTGMNCWFDRETGLPIRVEFETEMGDVGNISTVMDQFHTDVELDKSLFSLDPPAGYTVQNVKLDDSQGTIEDLGNALRIFAGQNKNVFPDSLPGPKDFFKLSRQITKESMKGLLKPGVSKKKRSQVQSRDFQPGAAQKMMDKTMALNRAMQFVSVATTPETDWRYVGEDVRLDTPDVPIFWYKPTGSEKYKVLYADLTVKELTKAQLPKTEPPTETEPRP